MKTLKKLTIEGFNEIASDKLYNARWFIGGNLLEKTAQVLSMNSGFPHLQPGRFLWGTFLDFEPVLQLPAKAVSYAKQFSTKVYFFENMQVARNFFFRQYSRSISISRDCNDLLYQQILKIFPNLNTALCENLYSVSLPHVTMLRSAMEHLIDWGPSRIEFGNTHILIQPHLQNAIGNAFYAYLLELALANKLYLESALSDLQALYERYSFPINLPSPSYLRFLDSNSYIMKDAASIEVAEVLPELQVEQFIDDFVNQPGFWHNLIAIDGFWLPSELRAKVMQVDCNGLLNCTKAYIEQAEMKVQEWKVRLSQIVQDIETNTSKQQELVFQYTLRYDSAKMPICVNLLTDVAQVLGCVNGNGEPSKKCPCSSQVVYLNSKLDVLKTEANLISKVLDSVFLGP